MKRKLSFSNCNMTIIQHHAKPTTDTIDALSKAYQAGKLTAHSTLKIYGAGAERGTWLQFAALHVKDIIFTDSIDALTWFTDIYNTAQRNQGNKNRSIRKCNYWLSQKQEIEPLLNYFGITHIYNQEWLNVKSHDDKNGLEEECLNVGRITDWKRRTLTVDISLLDYQDTIMENVVNKISAELNTHSYNDLLTMAFIEGFGGLRLGDKDIENLSQGQSIAA